MRIGIGWEYQFCGVVIALTGTIRKLGWYKLDVDRCAWARATNKGDREASRITEVYDAEGSSIGATDDRGREFDGQVAGVLELYRLTVRRDTLGALDVIQNTHIPRKSSSVEVDLNTITLQDGDRVFFLRIGVERYVHLMRYASLTAWAVGNVERMASTTCNRQRQDFIQVAWVEEVP